MGIRRRRPQRSHKLRYTLLGLSLLITAAVVALTSSQFIQAKGSPFMSKHWSQVAKQTISNVSKKSTAKTIGSATPVTGSAHTSGSASGSAVISSQTVGTRDTACTIGGAHPKLTTSVSSEIRKLAEYEALCGGSVTDTISFFAPTPATTSEAAGAAADMAQDLKAFQASGLKPVIFLEPNGSNGLLDLKAYRNGTYDSALKAYFSALKSKGITDSMMGTWVFFPEANLPEWTSIDPSDFVTNVTKTAQFMKQVFPGAKASIMLDSMTYPNVNSWEGGQYKSLLPYVQGIPAGLLDSFGLQGFPWAPPANEGGPANMDAHQYLRVDLALEAAQALGVHQVWLNSGSFGKQYASNSARTVTQTPAQRQATLDGALQQAQWLQARGMQVSVHLFAQNKASMGEGIDWSYWPAGQAASSPVTPVFQAFAHSLQANGIGLWLFDTN